MLYTHAIAKINWGRKEGTKKINNLSLEKKVNVDLIQIINASF